MKNELDCPLYVLSKRLCAVSSSLIDNSVSFALLILPHIENKR